MSESNEKPASAGPTRGAVSWQSAEPYEQYMGRWSRKVAAMFLEWLAPPPQRKWLDIGCGSGALSAAILDTCDPAELTAVDQSEAFTRDVQQRLGSFVQTRVGDALALPMADDSVDFSVSGLVLNYISEPVKALEEMKRVTVAGGTVALYVWDYSRKMEFIQRFWDIAVSLNPQAAPLHQSRRFSSTTAEALRGFFTAAGYEAIETAPIELETHFQDFDDYWRPFLGGQGPAPTYLMSLPESERQTLRDRLFASLPFQDDGSIRLQSRAWAVKGIVE